MRRSWVDREDAKSTMLFLAWGGLTMAGVLMIAVFVLDRING